jgi:hypothetical protein
MGRAVHGCWICFAVPVALPLDIIERDLMSLVLISSSDGVFRTNLSKPTP